MEIFKEYKTAFNELIKSKLFITLVILVTILSFGFTITNYSIGVDDTCLDRYYRYSQEYRNTNMLTADRWGSFILYNILGIDFFTPFWLDLLTTIVIVITAVTLCCFIKKEFKDKFNISVYIIFSCVYISYPIINEAFIYQASNLAVAVSILLMSISGILIYENFTSLKNKKVLLICIGLIAISSAMYEACCQVFLVGMFFSAILLKNKIKDKEIFKYIAYFIIILFIGILMNILVAKTFHIFGVPFSEEAEKQINWGSKSFIESIQIIFNSIYDSTIQNTIYLPVITFIICSIIGLVLYTIKAYKENSVIIILSFLGMFISNFAISILQLASVLYRTAQSWSLFVAIIITVAYIYMSKYKITQRMTIILIAILVLRQSRCLNQLFYNDYLRYQKDLNIAFNLIEDLEKNYDTSKPLVIMGTPPKGIGASGSQVNSLSVLWWGKKAFGDNGAEFIKFLNSLGYYFEKPTDEQYEKGKEEAESMEKYPKRGAIRELEDCIIVNF